MGGMEKAKPDVAGLPERILIVRQQFEDDDPESWPPGESRLSLNFQPAIYPHRPSPVIQMKPAAREFWRVANATSQAFLAMQVVFDHTAQTLKLIALDGIPGKSVDLRAIELPPGGRAEFLVTGPVAGQAAGLSLAEVETGRTGPENPAHQLATIVATADAQEPPVLGGAPTRGAEQVRDGRAERSLAESRATAIRKLYFAEAANGTNGPTRYFLTVEGQAPKLFDTVLPPAIVTKVGAVEDWILANRSGESHAFHMHRIHFLLLEVNGKKLTDPELRDTVGVPAWNGAGAYPTVRVRVDFRNPESAGTFLYHCHILHHAEAGMMGKVEVKR